MNLKVNLFGASMGVFTAMERMGRSKGGNGGCIVNTASIAG
jgi:NAD(P)-dependent dehydrogenase (short-subunit alcohol dehydrogenase family)